MNGDGGSARSRFSDVDASGVGAHLIGYLDAARRAPTIAAAKAWSIEKLALGPELSALDVGCGTGEDVVAMAEAMTPGGRAVGLDLSATMVEEARNRHRDRGDVEFVAGDARRLPFEPATFDACRSERTLQHLDDPILAVSEMARILRPGGRITLQEPDWGTLIVGGADPGSSERILAVHVRRHLQPFMGRQLRWLLAFHGFSDIELGGTPAMYTDLASADRAFGVRRAAEFAAAAGAVSEQEASRWSQELQEADADGTFFASVTGFRVCARLRHPSRQ